MDRLKYILQVNLFSSITLVAAILTLYVTLPFLTLTLATLPSAIVCPSSCVHVITGAQLPPKLTLHVISIALFSCTLLLVLDEVPSCWQTGGDSRIEDFKCNFNYFANFHKLDCLKCWHHATMLVYSAFAFVSKKYSIRTKF